MNLLKKRVASSFFMTTKLKAMNSEIIFYQWGGKKQKKTIGMKVARVQLMVILEVHGEPITQLYGECLWHTDKIEKFNMQLCKTSIFINNFWLK